MFIQVNKILTGLQKAMKHANHWNKRYRQHQQQWLDKQANEELLAAHDEALWAHLTDAIEKLTDWKQNLWFLKLFTFGVV